MNTRKHDLINLRFFFQNKENRLKGRTKNLVNIMGTIHLEAELEPSPETPHTRTIYISETRVNMHNATGLMDHCYTNCM
jgi:hypothetical protein